MTTVYMVTRGKYSDYDVCGIFTSLMNAQTFMDSFDTDFNDIQPMELDANIEQVRAGMRPWTVEMFENGDTQSCSMNRDSCFDSLGKPFFYRNSSKNKTTMNVLIMAADSTHAIKIANELRIAAIANNEWDQIESRY